jgi:hypothetical protein
LACTALPLLHLHLSGLMNGRRGFFWNQMSLHASRQRDVHA